MSDAWNEHHPQRVVTVNHKQKITTDVMRVLDLPSILSSQSLKVILDRVLDQIRL